MNEAALDASGDFLRSALNAAEELFVVLEPDGGFRHWNRAMTEVTGHSGEELASASLAAIVADGDADRVREALDRLRDTGHATVEVALTTGDGGRIPYEFRLTRMTDADGTVQGFAGTGRDITERRETKRQRQALLDRMTDAFLAVDEDWRLTYVNEQARPILTAAMRTDIEGDQLEGRHLWESIPDAVDTPFYERYHEAMETQSAIAFEEYYEPLDMWFEVRAYPSETGLSVYFRDITDRQRQREILQERERILREVYDVMSDPGRTFEEQVSALLEIGCDALETDYGTLSRIEGEDYVFEIVRSPDDAIESGDVVPLSATNCERTAAAERTLVLANIEEEAPELTARAGYAEWGIACYLGAPIFADERVYGTFCFYDEEPREEFSEWETTLVDLMSQWISYERTRQQTRERLERQNDHLEEFASIVSHDLRNPLNVVSGSLELAEETGDPDHFERCYRALDRMEALIDDLLSLASAGERITEKEPVALESLAEEGWTTVATAEASLIADIDGEWTIRADPSRLRQLVENLVRNAIEHGGETVTVRVGTLGDTGFYLEDDGPGIPEDKREQVFEAGYSTADGGTGFGLNIVQQIAEAHGWRVRVAEGTDGGARFEFTGVETA